VRDQGAQWTRTPKRLGGEWPATKADPQVRGLRPILGSYSGCSPRRWHTSNAISW
jgi:hypothetical protein